MTTGTASDLTGSDTGIDIAISLSKIFDGELEISNPCLQKKKKAIPIKMIITMLIFFIFFDYRMPNEGVPGAVSVDRIYPLVGNSSVLGRYVVTSHATSRFADHPHSGGVAP